MHLANRKKYRKNAKRVPGEKKLESEHKGFIDWDLELVNTHRACRNKFSFLLTATEKREHSWFI